jgi:hypothetical protein
MKHLETLHATSETQPPRLCNIFHASLMSQRRTPRSTFATSARNTCNILMKHLKHVEYTLATCTNPAARHECLLVAVTACPLPRAIPLLLSAEGAPGASCRRELSVRRPPPPPHIEKKGRRRPWAAAAHPAVGGGATGRGGAHHRQRRAHRRPSLPVEELYLLEKKKKGRERHGGRLTLSSAVENEASVFSALFGRPSPSITV